MTKSAKIGCLAFIGAIAIAACLVVTVAAYQVWQITEGTRLSQLGDENLRQGQYDLAIKNLTEATKRTLIGDDRYWVYKHRASAEKHLKKYDAAIADFSEAIRIQPDSAEAYEERGLAYEQHKENEKAVADFERAITIAPNRGISHLHRGILLYNDGDFERAQVDLDEACRIWPQSAHAFIMRGRCYLAQDDLDRALASFEAALAINPRSREASEHRIEVYRRQGETERAFLEAARLEAGAKHSPTNSAQARKDVPGSLGRSTRLDVAPLSTLKWGVVPPINQTFAAYVQQAIEAAAHRDVTRAIELYNSALILPITNRQASFATANRGSCYLWLGQFQRAQSDFDEAVRLDATNAGAYVMRGNGLAQNDEFDDALKDYEEAIRRKPDDYLALISRGQAFAHRGDLNSARADFDRAIELQPGNPEAYLGRADAFRRQSQFSAAGADAAAVIGFCPESVRAYVYLIKAYAGQNQMELARKALNAFKTIKPEDESVLRNALAWMKATFPNPEIRDGGEAVVEAKRACELTSWKGVGVIDTLAAAEAEAGDFASAAKFEEQALRFDVAPAFRDRMLARLRLYQQHQPYREPLTD